MDASQTIKSFRNGTTTRGAHFKNKLWTSGARSQGGTPTPGEGRWERGGHRGGRGRSSAPSHREPSNTPAEAAYESEDSLHVEAMDDDTPAPPSESRVKTWEEVSKARELERAKAIREGKMDDPTKPKRLEEAITIVGTCQDMCPEYERYRRERENNLDKWECIVGPDGKPTKKVDHLHAVKIYERGQGDKIIPSDLRPGPVLKRTLNYLFNELIPRGGFIETQAFVRDRSRAVRNDFTIQQDTGPIAIECHERCTRYHILSLHLLYDSKNFDRAMEIQQCMNSLLSLRDFYDDQRGKHQSENELEMRIYQRLGLIRDQKDRNDGTPQHILDDPAFQLMTRFRAEVQAASAPITRQSTMITRGNVVMIYLFACFLEHHFGRDTIEDIESIRGSLSLQNIIDGVSHPDGVAEQGDQGDANGEGLQGEGDDDISVTFDDVNGGEGDFSEDKERYDDEIGGQDHAIQEDIPLPSPLKGAATQWLNVNFGAAPTPPKPGTSVFSQLAATSQSVFGGATSVFANTSAATPFGSSPPKSVFGSVFAPSPSPLAPPPFGNTNSVFSAPEASSSDRPAPPNSQIAITDAILATDRPFSTAGPTQLFSLTERPLINVPAKPVTAGSSATFSQPAGQLNPAAQAFTPTLGRATNASTPSTRETPKLFPLQTETKHAPSTDQQPIPPSDPSYGVNGNKVGPLTINTGATPPFALAMKSRKSTAIDSPIAPPPLNRPPPLSLPGTPTSTFPIGPLTPAHSFIFPKSLINNGAPTPPGHLPPLFPQSPLAPKAATRHDTPILPSSAPTPPSPVAGPSSLTKSPLLNCSPFPIRNATALQNDALLFAQRSLVVQQCFSRWKRRATDVAAWKDACRRSEIYKKKMYQNGTPSQSPSSSSKRRRVSTDTSPSATKSVSRRAKRRAPEYIQRTDEELSQRFKENKEDHQRTWARGSFVSAVREHVHARCGHHPHNWRLWLCMNPDNDRTAIWLEQKFDVPSSGDWEFEAVFSIPISPKASPMEKHPGLIIFECVPLDDVNDDIERKYRVLDDCSRLRDIINALPPRRHFVPSLLIVNWADVAGKDAPQDVLDMANKFKDEGLIESHYTFSIASVDGDLDSHFADALAALKFDFEGHLVQWYTLNDLFAQFSVIWERMASIWIDTCGTDEQFNWPLFGHVLQSLLKVLNLMTKNVVHVWDPTQPNPSPLPCPDPKELRDVSSTHSALRGWLHSQRHHGNFLGDSVDVDFGPDLQVLIFLQHARDIAVSRINAPPFQRRAVLKSDVTRELARLETTLDGFSSSLQAIARAMPRPASKRRPPDEESLVDSQHTSPVGSPSPTGANKRAKLAEHSGSDDGAPPSPTPSAVSLAPTSVSTGPTVTIAMLRALSKNVMKNYAVTR